MYNRYIRSDNGVYTRIPEEEPFRPAAEENQHAKTSPLFEEATPKEDPGDTSGKLFGNLTERLRDFLNGLLEKFHLQHLDSGDLLLLAFLYLLYREDADEELLIALALLLIL